jgi:hypothetical protein
MVTNLSPLQISSNLVKKKKCGESKRNCSKKGPKKKKKNPTHPVCLTRFGSWFLLWRTSRFPPKSRGPRWRPQKLVFILTDRWYEVKHDASTATVVQPRSFWLSSQALPEQLTSRIPIAILRMSKPRPQHLGSSPSKMLEPMKPPALRVPAGSLRHIGMLCSVHVLTQAHH